MGYYRAGFEVIGVDIVPQKHYPFEFHQTDALSYPTEGFDAIHASPPCQRFTTMNQRWARAQDKYPNLIVPTRERLLATGLPYVIENVEGAASELATTLRLHGGQFGLIIARPRLFESNILILAPKAAAVINPIGIYGKLDGRRLNTRQDGSIQRAAATLKEAQEAMEMDWADWQGIKEAIPPAYTEFIGRQLMAYLKAEAHL